MCINDFFDKVWCLSALDKGRLLQSKQQFERLGMKVDYYYNPTNPVIHSCPKVAFETGWYNEKVTTHGYDVIYDAVASCFVGHYNIIKTSYELGYNKILVVEDDVSFVSDVDLVDIIEQAPKNWDYLNFHSDVYGRKTEKYANNNDLFWKKIIDTKKCCGNTMYAMNRLYMKKYIDFFSNHSPEVADRHLAHFKADEINCYENKYHIIKIDKHFSTIEKSESIS